jgi:hypothetical protein
VRDAESERLHALAGAHLIDDRDLASCWAFVLEAAIAGWMNGSLLDEYIEAIEAGTGRGVEEFGIDVDTAAPDKAVVSFISDERTCSSDLLLGELMTLRRARDDARALSAAEAPRRRRRFRGR